MRAATVAVVLTVTLAVSAVLEAHGGSPDDDRLALCARIAAPAERLACYDLLSDRAKDSSSVSTRQQASSSSSTSSPPTVEDPKNFGLSSLQQHVEILQIKSEEAHIVSIARGEATAVIVVLDNGQSWKILEDDGWLSKGSKVTIKRAALGSFLMHAPSNHLYHVSRVS